MNQIIGVVATRKLICYSKLAPSKTDSRGPIATAREMKAKRGKRCVIEKAIEREELSVGLHKRVALECGCSEGRVRNFLLRGCNTVGERISRIAE